MDAINSIITPILLLFIPGGMVFVIFGCVKAVDKKRDDRPSTDNFAEKKSEPKTQKLSKSEMNLVENQTQLEDKIDWNSVDLKKSDEEQKTDLDLVLEEDVFKNKTVRQDKATEDKKAKGNLKKSVRKQPSTVSFYPAEDTPASKEAKRVNNEKNALKTVDNLETVSLYQDGSQMNTKTVEEMAKNKGAKVPLTEEKAKSSKKDKSREVVRKKKNDRTETQKTEETKSKFDKLQKTSASRDGETERTEEPNWDEEPNKKSAKSDKKGKQKANFNASSYMP